MLQIFLHDRIIQLTFGVFGASFVYSMVVLQTVKPGADMPRSARPFLFVFASAAVFTLYTASPVRRPA